MDNMDIFKISVLGIVLILLTEKCLCNISGDSGDWKTLSKHNYIETTTTTGTINSSLVQTRILTTVSSTHCAFSVAKYKLMSFLFDAKSRMCQLSPSIITPYIDDNDAITLVYGEVMLLYEKEINTNKVRYTVYSPNFTSCAAVYDGGVHIIGIFNLYPQNIPTGYYNCDNGWLVFQRRQDGSQNFVRDWEDYVNGFGDTYGEFWLGLESLFQLTNETRCELYIHLEAEVDHPVKHKGYAHYSSFQVLGSDTDYVLELNGFSGDVLDSMESSNGLPFSTKDKDNDGRPQENCADTYPGGWWFNACYNANLNGLYLNGSHDLYGKGIHWSDNWGHYYSLVKTEMRMRCVPHSEFDS